MTCVVALSHNGVVYMGADSYGSDGYVGTYVANPKCFKNGEFLIGCAGTFRLIDILAHVFSVPKVRDEEHNDPYLFERFMRTVFIDTLRSCLKTHGHITIDSSTETGGCFLVGYRGKVYDIQPDFSVLNAPDYGSSVGCGKAAARGSLWTTKDIEGMKPEMRVLKALEAAEVVNSGVRGPFVQLSS